MGDHSKPARSALDWARSHRKIVLAFAAGAVATVTAIKPDFPGAAVLSVVHAVLGA